MKRSLALTVATIAGAAVLAVVLVAFRLGQGGRDYSAYAHIVDINNNGSIDTGDVHLEIDMVKDGSTWCDPVDASAQHSAGTSYQLAVCLTSSSLSPTGFQFDVVYDDTISSCTPAACSGTCLDGNPDANAGTTTFGVSLGSGWSCFLGNIDPARCDADAETGPGQGRARLTCLTVQPGTLPVGTYVSSPIAVVTFQVVGNGVDILALERGSVIADDGLGEEEELVSCWGSTPGPTCLGATLNGETPSASLSLDPLSATSLIAEQHTVTATISPATAGIHVQFTLTGVNAGASTVCSPNTDCTTDSLGRVSLTYTGTEPGNDTIRAEATSLSLSAEAVRNWHLPHGGIVFPVAGGSAGDGIPGTSAAVSDMHGLAVAPDGALIVADSNHHRIRRIAPSPGSPTGDGNVDGDLDEIISTIAGDGVAGYAGNGGPAKDASLEWPTDVAFDGSGNLYIADTNNHAIRKVSRSPSSPAGDGNIDGDADEIITTVAGNGTPGLCTDNAPATGACLNAPESVDIDASGNVFVADIYNLRIAKVTPAGTISTLPGTVGITGGVKVDSSGNIYIADWYNHMVRKINPSGVMTTIAGNGIAAYCGDGSPATSFCVDPSYLYADDAGHVWIAEQGNDRVRYLSGGAISTVAGNGVAGYAGDGGPATSASLDTPSGVVLDAGGAMFIADRNNSRIRRVAPATGYISTIAGTGLPDFCGDGYPALSSSCLDDPSDVATDGDGNLYIADTHNNRIRRVEAATGAITTVAGGGPGCTEPCPATQQALSAPGGVAVDASGNVLVADSGNNRIRKVTGTTITTVAGGGGGCSEPCSATDQALSQPSDVDTDALGNIYVADSGNNRIRKVTGTTITTVAGGGGGCSEPCSATQQALNGPTSVAVQSPVSFYIADRFNNRVRWVDDSGVIRTVAGTGSPGLPPADGALATSADLSPVGIEVDGDGHLLVSDVSHRVFVVTRSPNDDPGIVDDRGDEERIYTIVGGGSPTPGFCGDPDPGPPTVTHNGREACLNTPAGITYDEANDNASLYIVDQANQRVRKLPSDCDLDGLMDSVETGFANGSTEKCVADTDVDGYNDPQATRPTANLNRNQDNCPRDQNPDQLNTDAGRRPNGSAIAGEWASNPAQDARGDACDDDDDNDALPDGSENELSCPYRLTRDSDGDRMLDGFEVANGANACEAASMPACTDTSHGDSDGLNNCIEHFGYNTCASTDDTVPGWSTCATPMDSDGDGCADVIEVMDINGDRKVSVGDQTLLAKRGVGIVPPSDSDAVFDVNKDGKISVGDQTLMAKNTCFLKPGLIGCPVCPAE